jgi:uncharacterized lipoprotein
MQFKVNLMVVISLATFMCLTSGCAYSPQHVDIDPTLNLSESNIGNNLEVFVSVADERADIVIGHRGSAYGKAAKISNDQDICKVFRDAVVEGLKANGFNPMVDGTTPVRKLDVQVRLIKYETSTGFWTGGVHTKAAVKVVARNNGQKYEKMYRVQDEKRILIVPDAKQNAALINNIVSDVISEIFVDKNMLAFLAKSHNTAMMGL